MKLSHDECLEAMPQYINGMLAADMNRAMQEHVGHCNSCFEELCRRCGHCLLFGLEARPREKRCGGAFFAREIKGV